MKKSFNTKNLKALAKEIAKYEINNEVEEKLDQEMLANLSLEELFELDNYIMEILDRKENL